MHMCIDYAENRVRYRYLTKAWGMGGPPLGRCRDGGSFACCLFASVQRHTSLNRVGLNSV
jgi:hypothetical protein